MLARCRVDDVHDRALVITRIFDAPRSLVFKAWTEPEHLVRWWAPPGLILASCALDLRPGGGYRFCLRPTGGGREIWVRGVYREVVEPERLSFTWEWEGADIGPGHRTLVTVTFTEHGAKTKVNLYQSPLEVGSPSIDDVDREPVLQPIQVLDLLRRRVLGPPNVPAQGQQVQVDADKAVGRPSSGAVK